MPFPWGGDDDAVEASCGQQIAVRVGAAGVDFGRGFAGFLYDIVGVLEHRCVHVADGDNVDVRAAEGQGEVALPAEAGADDGEAHAVGGRGCRGRGRRGGGFGRGGQHVGMDGEAGGGEGEVANEVAAGGGHSRVFCLVGVKLR